MTDCIDHGKRGNAGGYAACYHAGQYSMLHRVAYAKKIGKALADIKGVIVRHTCDNPRCVNPDHLIGGTSSDNMRDCVERGRHVNNLTNVNHTNRKRGEQQLFSRWTEEAIRDMRAAWEGGEKQTHIAARYGCRQTDVSRIVNRKAWAHV